jgi:FAD binding domain/Berberine and berberine like
VPALTRRQFVQRTGQAVVAAGLASQLGWLSGCGGTGEADWQQLAGRLDGWLVLPADRIYPAVSRPLNHRYADVHPRGVVLCASQADARESLLWAWDNDVPIAVRSGGHNYAGYSTTDGLVIDFGRMKRVEVDAKRGVLSVEPRARNTDIYAGLQPHGVAISAGRCPTVAVGGLVLGGGVGFSSRKLGLTCDSLTEAEVITASGKVLTCRRATESGPVLGIARGWRRELRHLHLVQVRDPPGGQRDPLRHRVGLGRCRGGVRRVPGFDVARAGRFLGADRDGAPRASRDRRRRPPGHLGSWPVLRPKARARGAAGSGSERRAAEAATDRRAHLLAGEELLLRHQPRGSYEVKSSYASEPLSDRGIETLVHWVERWPGSSDPDGGGMAMFASGGAINEVPAAATAFVHRDEFALIAMETSWNGRDSESVVGQNLDRIEGFAEALRTHVSGFAYQNFIDRSQADWQHAYYGSNLPRLIDVKTRYDPDDVFHFQQSIPLT